MPADDLFTRPGAPAAVAARPVVLIVDDDELVVSTFGRWLRAEGYDVRLRAAGGRAPVAIVTGDYLIDEAILDRFEHLDARIVFKPLWLEDLTDLVRSLASGAPA